MEIPVKSPLTVALTLLALTASPLRADWGPDAVPVSTAGEDQGLQQSIATGTGETILVWVDERSSLNGDIYAQKIDADGNRLWTPANGVPLCVNPAAQMFPHLVSDGAGGAIVAWSDKRTADQFDVYAQRVDSDGFVQWTPDGIPISSANGWQIYVEITSDDAGGAIIAWEDRRSDADGDIYAQRVNASGFVQWTSNGVVVSAVAEEQDNLRLHSDGAGGALITWESKYGATDGYDDVYAQRLDHLGNPVWTPNGVVVCDAPGYQSGLRIVSDDAGGSIIAWTDSRGHPEFDVYAQRLSDTGEGLWTANGRAICAADGTQSVQDLDRDGAGGAVLTWVDSRDGNLDVYAQSIDDTGASRWTPEGVPVCTTSDDQRRAQIIVTPAGDVIVAWYNDVIGNKEVCAQLLAPNGRPMWRDQGRAICTTPGNQAYPRMCSDGEYGAVISWVDDRNGHDDVFAQRVDYSRHVYAGEFIQPQLNVANDEDVITVHPGIYTENLDLLGLAITLRSEDPEDPLVVSETILDGGDIGTVIVCENGEGPGTIVDGLTVTGGNAGVGGGMYLRGTSPTVRRCVFEANVQSGPGVGGGGVYVFNEGSPTLSECVFRFNTADGSGGGLCAFDGNVAVIACRFEFNTAAESGGGLYAVRTYDAGDGVHVSDCSFEYNMATESGGGLCLDNLTDEATVSQSAFEWNDAGTYGGGISTSGTDLVVTGCTFSDHTAATGGGIANGPSPMGDLTLDDCQFTDNVAWLSGGGFYDAPANGSTVSNCSFAGNQAWDGDATYGSGGAVHTFAGSSFSDCQFTQFNTAGKGGAIYCGNGSSTLIDGCTVAESWASELGGGLFFDSASTAQLVDCEIFDNATSGRGGGLYCTTASAVAVLSCRMNNNAASEGGGIYGELCSPTITDCLITNNQATQGGAINAYALDDLTVSGCTLADNSGGGIFGSWTEAIVQNSIIAFNTAGMGVECAGGNPPLMVCSDVYGNDGGDWVDCIAGQESENGNLGADPIFCRESNPGDPYTLHIDSPCAPEHSGSCGLIGSRPVVCGVVDVDGLGPHPAAFHLYPCSPNPFNPTTTLRFDVAGTEPVTLHIFDVAGRKVRSLLNEQHVPAGEHRVRWDGRDDGGQPVSSGAYFGFLISGDFRATQRMLLAK